LILGLKHLKKSKKPAATAIAIIARTQKRHQKNAKITERATLVQKIKT
jgi:hypothetical protein